MILWRCCITMYYLLKYNAFPHFLCATLGCQYRGTVLSPTATPKGTRLNFIQSLKCFVCYQRSLNLSVRQSVSCAEWWTHSRSAKQGFKQSAKDPRDISNASRGMKCQTAGLFSWTLYSSHLLWGSLSCWGRPGRLANKDVVHIKPDTSEWRVLSGKIHPESKWLQQEKSLKKIS